ncbi:VRR-NUC domain-containing protein [Shewanella sp. Isolate7]|uniref:VRR-NUC domain-containing protein n=1 Tax=Shewanella sp. Isolate7 TaxID=2908528 RepID=UPI001EFE4032|nr:VRR-NUC domain-containing protein [Shewanella sp. Isolate7]MCG9720192.1 VRR-NUC domain-containing protein [Shewanella sp. Isolate7]
MVKQRLEPVEGHVQGKIVQSAPLMPAPLTTSSSSPSSSSPALAPSKQAAKMPPALPVYYYLNNFNTMLQGVEHRYGDLLDEVELGFISTFSALGQDAQCLLVRLISRKGPWFCLPQLSYIEITDISAAISQLHAHELIDYERPETSWLLQKSTKAELIKALLAQDSSQSAPGNPEASNLGCAAIKRLKKSELIEYAQNAGLLARLLAGLAPEWHWFCLSPKAVYRRFELLYFERMSQSLSQFILADLGIHNFEAYSVSIACRSFNTRAELEGLYTLSSLYREFEEGGLGGKPCDLDVKKIDSFCQSLTELPDFSKEADNLSKEANNEKLNRMTQVLWLMAARQLERLGLFERALALYANTERPPSRERRTRCLNKLGRDDEALRLVELMLAEPLEESERLVARRLQKSLHRSLRRAAPKSWQGEFDTFKLECQRTATDESQEDRALNAERVEQSAARHLTRVQERQMHLCVEVENRLFASLFGLAFWDIIFADVRGAFANPYQSRPSDMYHSAFYPRRKRAIDARLAALASGDIEVIVSHFHAKRGITNDWVHWPLFEELSLDDLGLESAQSREKDQTPLLLELALAAFSGAFLANLFRHMLFDLRYYRAGFPDLICFHLDLELDLERPSNEDSREDGLPNFQHKGVSAELIEVKGPGDSLRDNQTIWLDWFNRHGVKASVCYLSWAESSVE